MLLPGEIFEFRSTGVGIFIWKVDSTYILRFFCIQCFKFKLERPVGKPAIPKIEKTVNWPGVNHFLELHLANDFLVICIKHHLNIRTVQHLFEHTGVALRRHRLKSICEIAVVPVCSYRNPCCNRSVEFRGIKIPLFFGVPLKKLFIKLFTHPVLKGIVGIACDRLTG